jgi:hypothetical protein
MGTGGNVVRESGIQSCRNWAARRIDARIGKPGGIVWNRAKKICQWRWQRIVKALNVLLTQLSINSKVGTMRRRQLCVIKIRPSEFLPLKSKVMSESPTMLSEIPHQTTMAT